MFLLVDFIEITVELFLKFREIHHLVVRYFGFFAALPISRLPWIATSERFILLLWA